MIKKLTLLLFIIASTSCGIKQKPKFIKVDSIKLINANPTKITLSANALFNNPNLIGGRLNPAGVLVYVNDISFGKIETEDFKVPANDNFTVPLKIELVDDFPVTEYGKIKRFLLGSEELKND